MSDKKINKDRVCFVPGCKTGYFSDQKFNKVTVEINPSLFKAQCSKTSIPTCKII
jgi:hypothetical protein